MTLVSIALSPSRFCRIAFLDDADRLARLRREARVLAALNHPNICGIHGLEEADGYTFLVLEFVDGETLAERLATSSGRRSPSTGLSLTEALTFAQQIAAALEAAHERGVVHRDLKPANVVVTRDGVAKVLDFGLAKGIDSEGPVGDLTLAPSDAASGGTTAAAVIGTAAYMSAEQAAGRVVDRRSDIWSFGVVLFEMVSGRRPFVGETVYRNARVGVENPTRLERPPSCRNPRPSTTAAAVHGEGPEAPAAVDRRCESGHRGHPERSGRASRSKQRLPFRVYRTRCHGSWPARSRLPGPLRCCGLADAAPPPVTRLEMALPDGRLLDGSGGGHLIALAPEGSRLVFVGKPGALYLRPLREEGAAVISGTEGFGSVREPTFSPDGNFIAFFAASDQTLKRIGAGGGAAVTICPAKTPHGMSWSTEGIVFGQGSEGIRRVSPESNARSELIVRVKENELAHGPQLLPGGKHVLYTLATGTAADKWDTARIVVQSLTSADRVTLINGGSDARYVPTGHIVYAVAGRLFAIAFDLERLETTGDPVPILAGIRRSEANWSGAVNISFSQDGSLAYVPGPVSASYAQLDLAVMNLQTGGVRPLDLPAGRYAWPRVSPGGRHVAVETQDRKESSIWTCELFGTPTMQRLTVSGNNNRFPVWISAGAVAFQSDRQGDLAIWAQAIGGSVVPTDHPGCRNHSRTRVVVTDDEYAAVQCDQGSGCVLVDALSP